MARPGRAESINDPEAVLPQLPCARVLPDRGRILRIAAVVDPQRDVDGYLAFAAEHGLRIAHVFLTHFHADFLAGHLELRDRAGATIYLGAAARAEYAFQPLHDHESVEFGRVRMTALETPGHTPESISLLVYDLAESASTPKAVLTGDTLFVGDVGRPDLRAALGWSATDLGAMLYSSLRDKLLPLPDSSLVYPAHGAGSLCGKAISKETVSTIGEQRASNYALQPMSQAAFIDLVTADQPDAPAYFTYDAVLNSRERPTLDQALARELRPLTIEQLARGAGTRRAGARHPRVGAFAAAHLDGSINIGLIGQYATWAGTILSREAPIVLVADPGTEMESALRLGRIGFDHVVGFLAGGLASAAAGTGAHRDDGACGRGRGRVTARVGHAAGGPRRALARRSARRSTSKEASASRSTILSIESRRCPRDVRCWCTAPADTGRRSRRACCSAMGLPT